MPDSCLDLLLNSSISDLSEFSTNLRDRLKPAYDRIGDVVDPVFESDEDFREEETSGGIILLSKAGPYNYLRDSALEVVRTSDSTVLGESDLYYPRDPNIPLHSTDMLYPIGIAAEKLLEPEEEIVKLDGMRFSKPCFGNFSFRLSTEPLPMDEAKRDIVMKGTLQTSTGRELYVKAYQNHQPLKHHARANLTISKDMLRDPVSGEFEFVRNGNTFDFTLIPNAEAYRYMRDAQPCLYAQVVLDSTMVAGRHLQELQVNDTVGNIVMLSRIKEFSPPPLDSFTSGGIMHMTIAQSDGDIRSQNGFARVEIRVEFLNRQGNRTGGGTLIWIATKTPGYSSREATDLWDYLDKVK